MHPVVYTKGTVYRQDRKNPSMNPSLLPGRSSGHQYTTGVEQRQDA
jgi:hypothetical protein